MVGSNRCTQPNAENAHGDCGDGIIMCLRGLNWTDRSSGQQGCTTKSF